MVTDGKDACGVIHKVLSLKERFREEEMGENRAFLFVKRSF